MDTIVRNLFLTEIIRILFVTVLLFWVKIPLFYKIFLVILSDSIDCRIAKWFVNEWADPNGNLYQLSDKVTDTITNGIMLFYVISNDYLENYQNNILTFLYLYRLIGFFFFLIFLDRNLLFYFPCF